MQLQDQEPQAQAMFVNVQGARVHYVHAGEGRALVLIHGLVGSTLDWRRVMPALASVASVYALDLVNMGKSQRVADIDAGLQATADRIAATMDALGVEKADIAGHSHGGAATLMFAALYPARVRSLILLAPANPYSSYRFLVRFYGTAVGRMLAKMSPYFPRWMQRIALGRMYGDPARIPKGSLEGYVDSLRIPGTVPHVLAIVRRWFADMAKLEVLLPSLAEVPTLLIWGDRDRAVDPRSAKQLQRILTRSELKIVPGGGHVLPDEMPEESSAILREWVQREPSSGADAAEKSAVVS